MFFHDFSPRGFWSQLFVGDSQMSYSLTSLTSPSSPASSSMVKPSSPQKQVALNCWHCNVSWSLGIGNDNIDSFYGLCSTHRWWFHIFFECSPLFGKVKRVWYGWLAQQPTRTSIVIVVYHGVYSLFWILPRPWSRSVARLNHWCGQLWLCSTGWLKCVQRQQKG